VSRALYNQLPSVDDYVRKLWTDNEGPGDEGDDDPPPPPTGSPAGSKKEPKARTNERWVSRTDPEAAIISEDRHRCRRDPGRPAGESL